MREAKPFCSSKQEVWDAIRKRKRTKEREDRWAVDGGFREEPDREPVQDLESDAGRQ